MADSEQPDDLVRGVVGGDAEAAHRVLLLALDPAGDCPTALLVAAALLYPRRPGLIQRAGAGARTTRDRQLVALARAYLDGDTEAVDVLVRDHLADHPDELLAAWIAAGGPTRS